MRTEYEITGLRHGITVQEWEEARGLPPYTVYPEARLAKGERSLGYFMYPREETPPTA